MAKAANLNLADTNDMVTLSKELEKFVKENRLFSNVQGKEYVNAEGWQYAGSRLGLTSYCDEVWDCSTDEEVKYKAKIVVENVETGRRVGQGFAVCSNKEQGKKYYQEFAIISMAQTRGVGKAYRLFLSQLMRMAGFEPTPAEEMDYEGNTKTENKAPQQAKSTQVSTTTQKQEKAPQQAPVEPRGTTIVYASAKQKEEIQKLLNNPVITKDEKDKMLSNLNRLDEARAKESIEKLTKVIAEREKSNDFYNPKKKAIRNGNTFL